MILNVYTDLVNIARRTQYDCASRDAMFNNPYYGAATTDYPIIYSNILIRMQFNSKEMIFLPTGEKIKPLGVAYIPAQYPVLPEDRIFTISQPGYPLASTSPYGIEYVLKTAVASFFFQPTFYSVPSDAMFGPISHYECEFDLPE